MLWFSDRDGLRSYANTGNRQADVYSLFFTRDSWDRFRFSKEDYALFKEIEPSPHRRARAPHDPMAEHSVGPGTIGASEPNARRERRGLPYLVAQVRSVQQMMKSRSMGTGSGAVQSATVELQVHLPDTVPALADEFLRSVVKNLQDSLSRAHESYVTEMERTLAVAKAQRENVESELDGSAGDVAQVRRQLETFVDLLQLNRQMPLEKAVDV